MKSFILNRLELRIPTLAPEYVFEHLKADSGGLRDLNFLKYMIDSKILGVGEAILKRTETGLPEEYFLERYKKMSYESERHFLCRAVIQDQLQKAGIETLAGYATGDLKILRENSNYDIVTMDFTALIDVGLTPARNYFRGLTDLRVQHFMLTPYFDDYMDDIVFFTLSRLNDQGFIGLVKEYEEGYKPYMQTEDIPNQSTIDK